MVRALRSSPASRRVHFAVVALLAAFLIAACTPSEERGGTYITFDADTCAFTINLRMAFWGDGATRPQVTQWTKAINDFWNGKAMKVGNCPLRVVATGQMAANHDACPRGFHCVEVKRIAPGTRHTSSVNLPEGNHRNGDGKPNGWKVTDKGTGIDAVDAEWDSEDIDQVAIHESAHMLGLDDEYREGDVKCGVADCVTEIAWGNQVVPQRHIDDLAKAADLRCPCAPTPTPTATRTATPGVAASATPAQAAVTVETITRGGKHYPTKQFRVAAPDRCPDFHYHGPGRALESGLQIEADPTPDGCGWGSVPGTPKEQTPVTPAQIETFKGAGITLP